MVTRVDVGERWQHVNGEVDVLDRLVVNRVWDALTLVPSPGSYRYEVALLRGPLLRTVARRITRDAGKVNTWAAFSDRARPHENRWIPQLHRFLNDQAHRVAAAYAGGKMRGPFGRGEAEPSWWEGDVWNAELRMQGIAQLPTVIDDFGSVMGIALGGEPFASDAANIVSWIEGRSTDMAGLVNGTTEDALRKLVTDLEATGAGVDDIAHGIVDKLTSGSLARAELIARTEIIGAANYAIIQAAKQSGVATGKEWLASADDRLCPICEDLDGSQVALEADFPDGDPPEHPDCRCTVLILTADEFPLQEAA